jgi:hypothetical protein
VSGQPIILCHTGSTTSSNVTAIADTFSTQYTWTKVQSLNQSGQDCEMWIGTGGSGTSGVITVTISTAEIAGGVAVPCIGASNNRGLSAIAFSGNNSSASGTTIATPTLGPLVVPGCAMVFLGFAGGSGGPLTAFPTGTGITNYEMLVSGSPYGCTTVLSGSANDVIGSSPSVSYSQTASDPWTALGAVVLPTGGPRLPLIVQQAVNRGSTY